jgi:hypothetical protein
MLNRKWKILILVLAVSILSSCQPIIVERTHVLEITYNNGDRDTLTVTASYSRSSGGTDPYLLKGDLNCWGGTIASGVRYFKILERK